MFLKKILKYLCGGKKNLLSIHEKAHQSQKNKNKNKTLQEPISLQKITYVKCSLMPDRLTRKSLFKILGIPWRSNG